MIARADSGPPDRDRTRARRFHQMRFQVHERFATVDLERARKREFLRNFEDESWSRQKSTVVVPEIHSRRAPGHGEILPVSNRLVALRAQVKINIVINKWLATARSIPEYWLHDFATKMAGFTTTAVFTTDIFNEKHSRRIFENTAKAKRSRRKKRRRKFTSQLKTKKTGFTFTNRCSSSWADRSIETRSGE